MKQIVLFLTLLCWGQETKAQFVPDTLLVICDDLNLREQPNPKSRILATLKNGQPVRAVDTQQDQYLHEESINGLQGHWLKIKWQNYTGYAFSPYLGTKYMLYYENAPMDYYPKVTYWYGVYYDKLSKKEIIKEIKTQLADATDPDTGQRHKVLSSNDPQKSLFILATNQKIKERPIGIFTERGPKTEKSVKDLRPGNVDWLYFETKGSFISSECYHLLTTGTYKISEYGNLLSDYAVYVAHNPPPGSTYKIIQNVSQYFGLEFSESLYLKYCGDIDADGKPDVILSGCSNHGCRDILFLSSMAQKGTLLKPIASFTNWDKC